MAENQKMYLVKVLGEEDARAVEKAISQDFSDSRLVKENVSTYPSQLLEFGDPTTAHNTAEQIRIRENSRNTEEMASYFFYGETLDELRDNLITLLQQPATPNGVNTDWTKPEDVMDFIAGAKVSALIVETTADAIDEWVRLGMAERREGEYEKKDDGATTKSAIAELALGIGAIKEIFSNPEKVVAYGEIHNVLNNSNIWDVSKPYDWEGIYKGSYVPSITVDNLQAMAKVKTNETTHSQLSDTERQVQEMIAKGMSVEDAKLLLSAWADTQAYETSKLGSMQDDGQDPNGE